LTAAAIIPARFVSTRFPGKIVATETGKPLVQHVVDQVRKCNRIDEIVVACDDERIVRALQPFNTRCVMTDPSHPSGTDRVAEAARGMCDAEIVVNVQGDEPEIEPETIDRLVSEMRDSGDEMETAATLFRPPLDANDPNLVKVVFNREQGAMYFSRSPIPFQRDANGPAPAYYLHVGIYAYARETLIRFAGWKPTPCELAEKLEQLRALEHGVRIGVTIIDHPTHGIDTPEQYKEFVKRFKQSGLHRKPATIN
jgi:3-deoxy-manno-octulosonate cytidylyltransferase (CMP-KDO synthetase)